MGPSLIFDKSFLQSLNPDEAVWLDQFFINNITPLFFIETLADLEKEVHKGRTPEQVVGNLAFKTPDLHSRPNVHHQALLEGELSGAGPVKMDGRPIISGGKHTELEGHSGVVFEEAPEQQALSRWQKGKFLDLERQQAKLWRRGLSLLSPEHQSKIFARWFVDKQPGSFTELKSAVDTFIGGIDIEQTLVFGLQLLGVQPVAQVEVLARWKKVGQPSLETFAPYFRHVFGVELFFYLGLTAGLISQRRTNKVDISYLYYLPFCRVFTSCDNLHVDTAPLFLGSDQSFVFGPDLKADLGALDRHYDALPDKVKTRGLYHFASHPPDSTSFLVTRLWDQHMGQGWREQSASSADQRATSRDRELMEWIRRQAEAAGLAESVPVQDSDDADHMILTRKVHMRKGKWRRFPPEVETES